MRHQSIAETFRAIKPRHQGVPEAAPISAAFAGSGSSFSNSLAQAAQEIAQLRTAYQAQADLIAANTMALERGSSASHGQSLAGSAGDTVKSAAEHLIGGSLFGMIPLISGIAHLFGGGSSTPPPLPVYEAPPSIRLDSTLRNMASSEGDSTLTGHSTQGLTGLVGNNWGGAATPFGPSSALNDSNPGNRSDSGSGEHASFSPHVTVNINAMDSQSFLDRSADIASAVREAVLNLHPLNSVLADL